MDGLRIKDIIHLIDFTSPTLYLAILHIMFNPFFWSVIGRFEYYTKWISTVFGGKKRGCYVVAAIIFSIGISRNLLFKYVVDHQEKLAWDSKIIDILGYTLYFIGIVLVAGATYQLGIIGTYVGDYFGLLLPCKVTGFPYNISTSPMYDGSSINFLAHSILYRSPVGVFLSLVVFIVYKVGCMFEDPFTEMLYSQKEKDKSTEKNKKVE